MTGFRTDVDIANRGLQHCGAQRIDATLGFAEESRQASECGFVYDKLRQAELRRNVWRFSIRKAVLRAIGATTMLLRPALWSSATTYFVGSIVADENGTAWISVAPDNLNQQPGLSAQWQQYFGPLTVSLYDSTTTYFAGELVYTAAGDGTNRVYLSLQSANADNPATATAWAATVTYAKDQIATYSSVSYLSLIDLNINQQPSLAPALWAAPTTYASGAQVGASDGVIYQSLANGNVGHDPVSGGGVHWLNTGVLNPWSRVFVSGAGSLKWRQIGGAEFPMGVGLTTINIVYPLGSGPDTQTATRNVFRLPAGFLRKAAQDPKAGSFSNLGAPTNSLYDDWQLEGAYIVSSESGPIALRFAADTVDVPTFDPMFCEGLACRIGYEVCEPLTQSGAKQATIAKAYDHFMTEARMANAVDTGSEEPPLDEYLAVRM